MPKQKKEISRVEYLETQAELGITKHIGGLRSTKILVKECHIKPGMHVLDVGCGIGMTAWRLAKDFGCKVTGVDISPVMVKWAKKNAKEEGVSSKTEFLVADAQKLPFKANTFDAVICESVLSFVPDKQKALEEFTRVVKKGGYVGINEAVWAKKPTKEVIEYFDEFSETRMASSKDYKKFLKGAKLKQIYAWSGKVGMLQEGRDRIELIGWKRIFRTWWLLFTKYLWQPRYLKLIKETARYPRKVMDYMGYGLFVGKK